ncbi:ABC transporter ATP-binding protein [uncultured Ferrovibrio sp.]|jgi:peptide/nickel transport system ATP-binding protein|uniref:ABC transporter ATP-binding protein n=1 Tax=uncultured Ferrovibrio sp. TaxID=1576913 RepID=UPI002626BC9B|nr:ABC transporter ATP-binding protein [uncultured Ferrovibrio sp.]
MTGTAAPIIDIRDLTVTFIGGRKPVHAVNGVTLAIQPAEVLALLGESGSGKSVTLRSLLGLHPPGRTSIGGSIQVAGKDVMALSGRALADFRGKTVSMIFQEPLLALDPVYTVGAQIAETIQRHEAVSRVKARARALALLQKVRIPSPERRLDAFPHEMSGGMRQRAMIALALACNPQILLADEPTTALDATVQIQILLLLRELQRELGLTVILVTHDIGVAVEVADRVAVMYAGRIVETGPVREIIRNPRHPYTQGLLASRAHGAMTGSRLDAIPGSPPDLADLPPGCSFAPRCKHAKATCVETAPEIRSVTADHWMRCMLDAEAAE